MTAPTYRTLAAYHVSQAADWKYDPASRFGWIGREARRLHARFALLAVIAGSNHRTEQGKATIAEARKLLREIKQCS